MRQLLTLNQPKEIHAQLQNCKLACERNDNDCEDNP